MTSLRDLIQSSHNVAFHYEEERMKMAFPPENIYIYFLILYYYCNCKILVGVVSKGLCQEYLGVQ